MRRQTIASEIAADRRPRAADTGDTHIYATIAGQRCIDDVEMSAMNRGDSGTP